jgi:hypothetical protein
MEKFRRGFQHRSARQSWVHVGERGDPAGRPYGRLLAKAYIALGITLANECRCTWVRDPSLRMTNGWG